MRTYGQYCPVARASEILGCAGLGSETFSELREGAPGIPRSLLSQRLQLLEQYGIVEHRDGRYFLTEAGRELEGVVDALGIWGSRWLEVAPEHLDAHLVLWSFCRHAEPPRRLVIRFELRDGPKRRFWVVLAPPDSEVCVKPPGFDEDLVVRTDSETLAKWHMGRVELGQAMHDGRIEVEGPSDLVKLLARLGLSRFAEIAPASSS